MNSNLDPDSMPDAPATIKKKQAGKLLSCLGALVIIILISYVTVPILCMYFIDSFFAKHAPKQEDINLANETIQRINDKMDDFEKSLQPIREQIEALDHRVPKSETSVDQAGQNNDDND